MARLYSRIEPFETGMLDVGDGQRIYWEVCGNPNGKPALVLHGGPGSGCTEGVRRFFDPERYRIVLFDQRNCGRSTPHASVASTDLRFNTTQHLISDIEKLRAHLGIERWLLFGGSWGTTLALAYAEKFPERVTEMVLFAVTNTRPSEIRWLYHGAGRTFPEAWARFRDGARGHGDDLVAAYYALLNDPDPAIREKAARDWCDWEDAVTSTGGKSSRDPRYDDPKFRMCFARIVTHYFHHKAWLADGELIRNAHRLAGIPAVLIHGAQDISTPLDTASELARSWQSAELVVVDEAGHETKTPAMLEKIVEALDRFALSHLARVT